MKLPRLGLVRKFFKKLTVLSTIVGLLFQSFIPTVLLAYPAPVIAVETTSSPSVSLQYDNGAHTFSLDVFGVSKTSYTLTYQRNGGVTEAVEGNMDASDGVAHASLYAGTCSTNGICVPHDVQSGAIYVDALYGDTQSYMYDENFSFNNGVFWNEHDRVYTTPKVELNKTYVAPQNGAVTVTFTSLPTNPGTLSIQELTLTEEQELQLGAVSDKAYDITSTMADGTFTYTLTLPVPDLGENSDTLSVASSEDGQHFEDVAETQQTFHEEKQEIEVRSLDHFTVFVIRDPSASGVDGAGGSWVNPSNVYVSDNARATVLLNLGATSENLLATEFGLSVPGTAVIEGVEVMIEKSVSISRTNASKDLIVSLVVGGVVVGNDNAEASYFNNTIDAVTTYGSSSDLWGLTLTPAQVNAGDFGVAYAAQRHPSGSSDQRVRVDHMQVKVYYNTPPIVALTSPNGGEVWKGGTSQDITWTASDVDAGDAVTVDLEYSEDGGVTYTLIASGLINTGTYSWTVPIIDSTTVKIRATASDGSLSGNDASDADFTIDSTAPLDPSTPTSDVSSPTNQTLITWTWTAATDLVSGLRYYIWNLWKDAVNVLSGTTTETSLTQDVSSYGDGSFTLDIQAEDNAGNAGSVMTSSATTVDTVQPLAPSITSSSHALSTWSSDRSIDISWTVTDPDPSSGVVGYSYAWNTSASFTPDTTSEGMAISTTSPNRSTGQSHYFHVRAVDGAGNWGPATDYGSFWIDANNPTGSWVTPLNGTYVNGVVPLEVNAADVGSGVDFVRFRVKPSSGSFTTLSTDTSSPYTGTWDTTTGFADGSYVLRARISDVSTRNVVKDITVTVDNTLPTTIDSGIDALWHNTDVTVTFTCDDGTGSGCAATYYTTDGSDPTTSSSSGSFVTLTTDGEYTVKYFSVDNLGNTETIKTAANTVKIDKTKPTSTISDPANAGTGSTVYTNSWAGALGGSSADTLASVNSGVDRVDLSIKRSSDGLYWDGATWVAGTEATTRVTAPGAPDWTYALTSPTEDTYTITSHAVDNATNVEDSYVLTIVYDLTLPTVDSSISPATPDLANDWYGTEPTITVTGADNILLNHLEYQWNGTGGAWTVYSAPFKTLGEGGYVVYFRAIDEAGNISLVGSRLVKYDKTELDNGPLNLSISPNPTSGSTAKVKWDAAKDNVGISKYEVQWTLNGSSTGYTATVGSDIREYTIDNLTEGTWTVRVRAFDDAGHNKDATINEIVDRTPPGAPILGWTGTGPETESPAWNTVSDATDYIIWYGITTGNYIYGARVGNVSSYTVQGLGAGSYFFIVRAVDATNNQSANSNEVATGAIAGAPGVQPGAPAVGFAPEVLGQTTESSSSAEQGGQNGQGSVEGAQTNDWEWLWWLLLTLPIGAIIYLYLRKRS